MIEKSDKKEIFDSFFVFVIQNNLKHRTTALSIKLYNNPCIETCRGRLKRSQFFYNITVIRNGKSFHFL